MQRIKNFIKLTNVCSKKLSEKEQERVVGGLLPCYCGCYYCGCGGSSKLDNKNANSGQDLDSALPPVGASYSSCK